MAKLNKDQIKYAVQRANNKLDEKLNHLRNSITKVEDPRQDALKVYDALYSGERMSFPEFFKKFESRYYFANGAREIVEDNVGFMDEYNRYELLLIKLNADIEEQRINIQDKLYLSDNAADVLALIDAL